MRVDALTDDDRTENKNRCIDFQKEKFFDHRWSILEAVDKIRIRYNSYTNFNKRELVYFSTMGY